MECGMAFVRRRKSNPPMILLCISLASFPSVEKEIKLLILPVLSRIPPDSDDPFYTNLVDDSPHTGFRILWRVDFPNDVLAAVFIPLGDFRAIEVPLAKNYVVWWTRRKVFVMQTVNFIKSRFV